MFPRITPVLIVVVLLAAFTAYNSFYVVTQTEMAANMDRCSAP